MPVVVSHSWHFIGTLQSNKVKQVAACPNLFLVHTLPSEKVNHLCTSGVGCPCPHYLWSARCLLRGNRSTHRPRRRLLPQTARALNKACAELRKDPLGVLIQVNTSGEESKGGVDAKDAAQVSTSTLLLLPLPVFASLHGNTICARSDGTVPATFATVANFAEITFDIRALLLLILHICSDASYVHLSRNNVQHSASKA